MRYLDVEDLKIATRFVFLSMAITVLKQDLHYIQKGKFKIKEPYIFLIEQMISLAVEQRRKLRKRMYALKLTVTRVRKNDLFTTYLFVCKRREEERTYFNPVIRNKVKEIIFSLLNNVLQQYYKEIDHKRDAGADRGFDVDMKTEP